MAPITSAPITAAAPAVQRAVPGDRPVPVLPKQASAPFSAIVLADPTSAIAIHLRRTLIASGARDIRYASSPADLLRGTTVPAGSGVCIICGPPSAEAVQQLVIALRHRGWRRIVITDGRADEQSVRLAIACKVRCLVRRRPSDSRGRRRTAAAGALDLSGREVEVLQAVADGHTNNEVGELLGLSGLTVKSHLARIGRKTGTGDRAQMVAVAMRAGLIS